MGMTMNRTIKTYRELCQIEDYYERFEYARLYGRVGQQTFGWERYLNQMLYRSPRWRRVRDKVIIRDDGNDLAHKDFPIGGRIYIHHLNPLTAEDIEEDRDIIYDPELLVCVAFDTHQAIHYGDAGLLPRLPVERRPGDTCPWR